MVSPSKLSRVRPASLYKHVIDRAGMQSLLAEHAAGELLAFLHGYVTLERAGLFGTTGPKGGFARGVKAMAGGLRRPGSGGYPAIVEPVA